MRAKFFVNFPVLSFGEEMQIDIAHNGAVLIRIPHELFCAVQFYEAELVRNVALRAGNCGAKEPFLIDSFRSRWLVRFSIEHDLDRARVRAKGSNLHIIADLVRTQHAKRIRMKASDKPVDLVPRDAGNLKRFHCLAI